MNRFIQKFVANFNAPKQKRPLWFIDAKWIFALLFLMVFAISMTSYNIMQLTNRERAVESITGMIEDTLNNTEGNVLQKIEEYKQSLSENQNEAAEGEETDQDQDESVIGKALNLFFPESEIQNKSASDLKDGLLENLAVPIYEEGTSIIFTLLKGVDYATPIDSVLNKIPIYSDETHDKLMSIFVTTLVISFILLAGVVYFSWRWGKIFNSGLVIAITAAPGFLGYGYAQSFIKEWLPNIGADGGNFFINTFVVGIIQTLEKNVKDITTYQSVWFWIGIALIVIAIAGKIFFHYRKGRRHLREELKEEVKKELAEEKKETSDKT